MYECPPPLSLAVILSVFVYFVDHCISRTQQSRWQKAGQKRGGGKRLLEEGAERSQGDAETEPKRNCSSCVLVVRDIFISCFICLGGLGRHYLSSTPSISKRTCSRAKATFSTVPATGCPHRLATPAGPGLWPDRKFLSRWHRLQH